MKTKFIKTYMLNFAVFSLLVILDIFAGLFGLSSYENIFQTNIQSLVIHNGLLLVEYAARYFLILAIFCIFPTIIVLWFSRLKNQLQTIILILIQILTFSAIQFPQLYYPFFRLDFVISKVHSWILFGIYFFLCALILTAILKYQKNTLGRTAGVFIFLLMAGFQCAGLIPIKASSEVVPMTARDVMLVISIDSIRSDSISEIKKYAQGTFKDYLSKSQAAHQIISDSTQTRDSFYSIFSGKNSFELKNRYPFSGVFNVENQNNLYFLQDLKSNNYRTVFFRDEQETVHLPQGPTIDRVLSSAPSEKLSILLNKISHSFVIFQLLPHQLAQIISPTFFNTSSQAQGYKPHKIVSKIIHGLETEIETSNLQNKKTFAFLHTCMTHTPVKLPYPYNQDLAPPRDNFEAFSYSDFKKYPKVIDWESAQNRHSYDYRYYSKMIQYMTEEFLNPLFEQINEAGLYHPENIIVMSDHGENFWNNRKFIPLRQNFPFHGDTDLFGAQADKPLFISRQSFDKFEKINLSQALGLLINQQPDSGQVYTESSFSLADEGKDFLHLLKYSTFVTEYALQQNKSQFSISENFDLLTSLYVQKSFYNSNKKISVYRTPTGRKIFVCAYTEDLECAENLWFQDKKSRQFWISEYNKLIQSDVTRQKEIPIVLTSDLDIDQTSEMQLSQKTDNPWLKLYANILKSIILSESQNLEMMDLDADQNVFVRAGIKEAKARYLDKTTKQEADFSEDLSTLDSIEKINELIMSNRLEKTIGAKIILNKQESLKKQFSSLNDTDKKRIFEDLKNELENIFHLSAQYQLPFQNQNYWILLLKFSADLDQNKSLKKSYEQERLRLDVSTNFREKLEKHIRLNVN